LRFRVFPLFSASFVKNKYKSATFYIRLCLFSWTDFSAVNHISFYFILRLHFSGNMIFRHFIIFMSVRRKN